MFLMQELDLLNEASIFSTIDLHYPLGCKVYICSPNRPRPHLLTTTMTKDYFYNLLFYKRVSCRGPHEFVLPCYHTHLESSITREKPH